MTAATDPRALIAEVVGRLCAPGGEFDYVVTVERRISYAEHAAAIASLAHELATVHGVGKGDRVAILAANSPEWIVAFWRRPRSPADERDGGRVPPERPPGIRPVAAPPVLAANPGTVGSPIATVGVQIRSASGTVLADGDEGEPRPPMPR